MADRQGVEIDYCPKCRGVWLDKGELDKIIERSAAYTMGPEPDRFDDDHKQYPQQGGQYNDPHQKYDPHYKHKKKKGFLGDFFDFD
jgi:Zn-finger nucleic acid-binding protein